jgi:hypothetical protein
VSPIEVEDSEMEEYRPPVVERLVPIEESKDKGKGREIAEGILLRFL